MPFHSFLDLERDSACWHIPLIVMFANGGWRWQSPLTVWAKQRLCTLGPLPHCFLNLVKCKWYKIYILAILKYVFQWPSQCCVFTILCNHYHCPLLELSHHPSDIFLINLFLTATNKAEKSINFSCIFCFRLLADKQLSPKKQMAKSRKKESKQFISWGLSLWLWVWWSYPKYLIIDQCFGIQLVQINKWVDKQPHPSTRWTGK